jgi:hypothetical protein
MTNTFSSTYNLQPAPPAVVAQPAFPEHRKSSLNVIKIKEKKKNKKAECFW